MFQFIQATFVIQAAAAILILTLAAMEAVFHQR
jgi:hypothetical protein